MNWTEPAASLLLRFGELLKRAVHRLECQKDCQHVGFSNIL